MEPSFNAGILLGGASATPGLYGYDIQRDEIRMVDSSFSASIYALVGDSDRKLVLGGGRQGRIHYYDFNKNQSGSFAYGEPLLALCCLEPGRLVVADTKGRCEVLSVVDGTKIKGFATGNETICSLAKNQKKLFGLSIEGNVFVWDLETLEPTSKIKSIKPSRPFALVDLKYISSIDSMVAYPGENGRLALLFPDSGETKKITAHRGELFAYCLWQQMILSIGFHDGQLKLWTAAGLVGETQLVAGVVKVESLGEDQIIVFDGDGRMSMYRITKHGVQKLSNHSEAFFRSCLAIPNFTLKPSSRAIQEEVKELVNEITVLVAGKQDANKCHNRLLELGYEHLSLNLKADAYIAAGNKIEAAVCYQRILAIIPPNLSVAVQITHQYAFLLENFGLLDASIASYRKIESQLTVQPQLLPDLNQAAPESWIFDAEKKAPEIAMAAETLKIGLSGRFLLVRIDELHVAEIQIQASELYAKYKEACQRTEWPQNLEFRLDNAIIIGEFGNRSLELITIALNPVGTGRYLQLGVMVDSVPIGSVLTPVVILDCRCTHEDQASAKQIHDLLTKQVSRSVNMQISEAMEHLNKVLNCVCNDKLARREKL